MTQRAGDKSSPRGSSGDAGCPLTPDERLPDRGGHVKEPEQIRATPEQRESDEVPVSVHVAGAAGSLECRPPLGIPSPWGARGDWRGRGGGRGWGGCGSCRGDVRTLGSASRSTLAGMDLTALPLMPDLSWEE